MRISWPGSRWWKLRDGGSSQPAWADLVPAVPVLGVAVMGSRAAVLEAAAGERVPDLGTVLLAAVAGLTLLLRRRAPLTGFVGCGLAVTGYLVLGYPFGPVLLAPPAATYAIARVLPWRVTLSWTGSLLVVTGLAVLPRSPAGGVPSQGWLELAQWYGRWSLFVAAGAVLGAAITTRRGSEAAIRAEKVRRAVSEERLAMAREVHDGVGHGLAVIAMHAGVALHVFERDPDRARDLLRAIQATSRDALDDLRGELERFQAVEAPRRPRPGPTDLPVLLDRMRAGGLELDTDLTALNDRTVLPTDVAAAVYRIVQESLTNVLRHARTRRATVRVVRDQVGALVVEVSDDGPGAAPAGPGTGIPGMRQRVADAGGSLVAGPRPDRGFTVRAVFPVVGDRSKEPAG